MKFPEIPVKIQVVGEARTKAAGEIVALPPALLSCVIFSNRLADGH